MTHSAADEWAEEQGKGASPQQAHVAEHGVLHALQSLLTIIVVAVFIIAFIAQPFRIPSGSMENTLLVGDFLLVNKQVFAPAGKLWGWLLPYEQVQPRDIIVFHYPVDPTIHLVKRVVGVPGDRLHLERGLVFIDGEQLHEPYAVYRPTHPDAYRDSFPNQREGDAGIEPQWWTEMSRHVSAGELTIPPARYFVMGDNRNDSEDSRYWGFVPRGSIVGQPLLVYFSLRESGGESSVLGGGAASVNPPRRKGLAGLLLNPVEDLARWDRSLRVIR